MALLPAGDSEFGVEIRDAPPAHLLLKIQTFSKLLKHGVEKHESREFTTGNYKWRLIIYPRVSGGNDISVYLSVANTESLPVGWEVNAKCTILLHNHISDNYFCFRGKSRHFDAKNSRWGFSISNRMLTDPSNGYLVDDSCAFGAEVFLNKSDIVNECLSLVDWKISDYTKLEGLWTSEEFTTGGLRWKMKLYPNGNLKKDTEGKSVSIYLECVDSRSFAPHEMVKADICFRIKNKLSHAHISKQTSHWFTFEEDDWGFTNFISISDMCDPSKGFIVNDCCFLEARISVQDVVYTPKTEGP